MIKSSRPIQIVKIDEEKKIIKGIVYEPNVLDSQEDWMTAEDIEKMAHRFMRGLKQRNIDIKHNLEKIAAYVCESYITKEGDPEGYPPGAWVVCIKIEDEEVWVGVLDGSYGGLSMFGSGRAIEGVVPGTV